MAANHQEQLHSADFDYREGSPHLKHPDLYEMLLGHLRQTMDVIKNNDLPNTMLEIGAGEGSFVEPALAYGFDVSATEMSIHSVERLQQRYGQNSRFSVMYDPDGSLTVLGRTQFSVILFASVLHHIPDYETAIQIALTHHLQVGGSFLSFQDPLWYPSLSKGERRLSQVAYATWRVKQGNYARALQTMGRRIRGIHDDANPSDTVEYHVVRNGVDHQRLIELLSERFDKVSLVTYWSTQSPFWQKIGKRLGARSTFALHCNGFRG